MSAERDLTMKKKLQPKSHHIILSDISSNDLLNIEPIVDLNGIERKVDAKENVTNFDCRTLNAGDPSSTVDREADRETDCKPKKKRSKSDRIRKKKSKEDHRRLSLDTEAKSNRCRTQSCSKSNRAKKAEDTANRHSEDSAVFVYNGIEYCSRGCNTDREFNLLEEFDWNDDVLPMDEEDEDVGLDDSSSMNRDLNDNLERLFGFKFPDPKSSDCKTRCDLDASMAADSKHDDPNDLNDEASDEMLRKLMMNSRMNSKSRRSNGFTRLKTIFVIFVLFFVAKWFSKNMNQKS